jgi:hypothetical protein
MEYVSLKTMICQSFAAAPTTEPVRGSRAYFLTPMGLVSGSISMPPKEEESTKNVAENMRVLHI